MPHYDPEDCIVAHTVATIEFDDDVEVENFSKSTGLKITSDTKSLWFPQKKTHNYVERYVSSFYDGLGYSAENMPKYPIYIVSKSRFEVRPTSDSLIKLGLRHYIIVEESQYSDYFSRTDRAWVDILVLPKKYLEEYDTCDSLGDSKSKCPGAARNFAWDHSISIGAERHWVMDDNQNKFYRHDSNKRTPTLCGSIFRAMEDHTNRFDNVAISGPHYRFFVVPRKNLPPFVQNCRIYSCLLIRNDIPFRWRGRYNEDTDLSLRVLKSGLCTIQYNAFTTGKMVTQAMKGGNTEEFYSKEGTLPKSEMIEDLHPDVAKVKWMNRRWHHYVDYSPFRSLRLRLKENYYRNVDKEYGMRIEDFAKGIQIMSDYYEPNKDKINLKKEKRKIVVRFESLSDVISFSEKSGIHLFPEKHNKIKYPVGQNLDNFFKE